MESCSLASLSEGEGPRERLWVQEGGVPPIIHYKSYIINEKPPTKPAI
jgi:hypothetical protein